MAPHIPTQRISAKNQVTLPRSARGLLGTEKEAALCGLQQPMRCLSDDGKFPVVLLMTENELRKTEQRILDNESLDPLKKQNMIMQLNGKVHRMSVDGQNRIVLPGHFVEYLGLERDVFMFSTNNGVAVWNPKDWEAYNANQDEDELGTYLLM
ncbi:MAG: hypothetical protein HRU15_07290 [Planctomycetes bacterium]|nr:hypothetical protein [Planctomycetota bacterium]